jgi:hypothetical protein
MNVPPTLLAVKAGATVASHRQVVNREEALGGTEGKICGARVRDKFDG